MTPSAADEGGSPPGPRARPPRPAPDAAEGAPAPASPSSPASPEPVRDPAPGLGDTLAFVESPVQLLNVLEWAYATAADGQRARAPRTADRPGPGLPGSPLARGVPRQPGPRDQGDRKSVV